MGIDSVFGKGRSELTRIGTIAHLSELTGVQVFPMSGIKEKLFYPRNWIPN